MKDKREAPIARTRRRYEATEVGALPSTAVKLHKIPLENCQEEPPELDENNDAQSFRADFGSRTQALALPKLVDPHDSRAHDDGQDEDDAKGVEGKLWRHKETNAVGYDTVAHIHVSEYSRDAF